MSQFVFKMPDLGEGTVEAEIVAWHTKPGAVVDRGSGDRRGDDRQGGRRSAGAGERPGASRSAVRRATRSRWVHR